MSEVVGRDPLTRIANRRILRDGGTLSFFRNSSRRRDWSFCSSCASERTASLPSFSAEAIESSSAKSIMSSSMMIRLSSTVLPPVGRPSCSIE